MSADIQIQTEQVRDAAGEFNQAARTLDELMSQVNAIADALDGGALLGPAGDAMSNAIRSNLAKSVNNLQDKLYEISSDLYRTADIYDEAEGG